MSIVISVTKSFAIIWNVLTALEMVPWGVSGDRFEASEGPLGAYRRYFGASWRPLEASL